ASNTESEPVAEERSGSTMSGAATKRKRRVLLGCTGSVASIKVPQMCQGLLDRGLDVAVVCTQSAEHFLARADRSMPEGVTRVWRDSDEWSSWQARGDPVVHIDLRNWADLLLLAPLDANTLAKLSCGLCDNLLTCIARAWPVGDFGRPIIFALAMNSAMYQHPLTAKHVAVLKNTLGYIEVPVVAKKLMCGEVGAGAMAEPDTIVEAVMKALSSVSGGLNGVSFF
ncbi:hypothetical protein BOX15_Mlig019526g2, partial [Macrostomum lignano]|uniref:Flavoprotein domain-containing protein n=2 Tax=Macrostomum lignano TaxID=282301 RepID=A0A1I8JFB1_9PLAT